MATYQEQIEKARREKEAKAKAAEAAKAAQLSPEQIEHWRLVLANMGVPFAMSMPESYVQRFRDAIQAEFNTLSGDEEKV